MSARERVEIYHTSSPDETHDLARRMAATLKAGALLILTGELGAGKTTFVKGLAEGLGITCLVRSPTFTVVNIYKGPLTLYHIDLYRLEGSNEFDDIGLDDYLYRSDGISAVEWGERMAGELTGPYLSVRFFHDDGDKRRIEVEQVEPRGGRCQA